MKPVTPTTSAPPCVAPPGAPHPPMRPADAAPASFAERALFEPIAPLLRRFTSAGVPPVAALEHLLHAHAPGLCSGGGKPLRFADVVPEPTGYERHIHATGEIPTRSGDWHDFFNALAWCVWPRAKSTCNALHLAAPARDHHRRPGRGPLRDALTQFDECGIVVASTSPDVLAGLRNHEWEGVMSTRRVELLATTRFLVFGHGTWDQLRQPFVGLCAKALYRLVPPGWLALEAAQRQAECDLWLADWLATEAEGVDTDHARLSPRAWSPLPLLGIPGVTPDNAAPAYYRDTRQFRPRRTAESKRVTSDTPQSVDKRTV